MAIGQGGNVIQQKRISLDDLVVIERTLESRSMCLADFIREEETGFVPLDEMTVAFVAKVGDIGTDWAAYVGMPAGTGQHLIRALYDGIDLDTFENTLAYGNKIYPELAAALFPEFVAAGLSYRP